MLSVSGFSEEWEERREGWKERRGPLTPNQGGREPCRKKERWVEVREVQAWWWCVTEERKRESGMCRTGDQSINKLTKLIHHYQTRTEFP